MLLNVYLHKPGSELQVDLVLHQQLLWCSVPPESAEKFCELLSISQMGVVTEDLLAPNK